MAEPMNATAFDPTIFIQFVEQVVNLVMSIIKWMRGGFIRRVVCGGMADRLSAWLSVLPPPEQIRASHVRMAAQMIQDEL